MGPLANGLFVRIAAVLLGVLVVFNIIMAAGLLAPVGRERAELRILPLTTQAAAIVHLLEATPPAERPRVLAALNSPSLTVQVFDRLPPEPKGGLASVPFLGVLGAYDRVFADHEFHIDLRRRGFLPRVVGGDRDEAYEPVRLFVRLRDGPYVVMEPARAAMFDTFLSRGLAFAALAGLVIIAGLILAVRQTARPVATLAANARAFADRLDAPDLPERGPKELRDLAQAFNHMKARIRELVSGRTRFLAAIAHDLRTYLTRLRLRAEFIADDDHRQRFDRDLDEMAALLEDTLTFAFESERRADPDARTDIAEAVGEFIAARLEVGEPVSLIASPPAGASANVDAVALRRILSNLTDNAIRYGGAARLSVSLAGQTCTIQVDDDGPGIPEADIARVTTPFERVETSRARTTGGAGLGLAIVRALVESQAGKLLLLNRDGGGLTAEVRLIRA